MSQDLRIALINLAVFLGVLIGGFFAFGDLLVGLFLALAVSMVSDVAQRRLTRRQQ